MKVNDYVRTKNKGIFKIDERCYFNKDFKEFWFKAPCDYGNEWTTTREVIKSSPNIIDLLQPMDLIYVDVDNNYAGGIIIPRIAETQAELNVMINLIKSGKWILKGVVTSKQLDSMKYKVGD